MERQKQRIVTEYSSFKFIENRLDSFNRVNSEKNSFAVYEDGTVGIFYTEGSIGDDEGYSKADDNLALERPYKFDLETGVRSRDLTEKILTGEDLKELTAQVLDYVGSRHPDFRINGQVSFFRQNVTMTNSKGLDLSDTDGNTTIGFSYKHKDSKDLDDGYIHLSKRSLDTEKFKKLTDNFLDAYNNPVELPKELIIQDTYYGYLSEFYKYLNAEDLSLGTSLLSGKLGQKVFSDKFTLWHNVSKEKAWASPFFDGEGVIADGDIYTYIKDGVLLTGFADKRIADKYGVPHTGSAARVLSDIPQNGGVSFHIPPCDKTAKQLLDGRLSVVPIQASGGGFNEKGDFVMPVQNSMLCDGEKFIGRLPQFTMSGNIFDMFGDGFIGVTSDDAALEDKTVLMKMNIGG